MKHHEPGEFCPLCEEKLSQAHPRLVQWYRERVKKRFLDAHVSWAHRGEEDQKLAVAMGRSKAIFPSSKHNVLPAEALDLFQIGPDKVARFRVPFYTVIAQDSEEAGDPIRWGGKFNLPGGRHDYNHFELSLDKTSTS